MRACSSASQVNSSAIRCCGSMLSASIFDSAKNSASKPLMSDEVAAAGAGLGDPLGDPRLAEEFLPAALGQVGDGVAALEQRLPRLVGGVHVAGEPGGDADDRDVVDIALARPVLVAVDGIVDLRLTLDDDRAPAPRWSDAGTPRWQSASHRCRSSISLAIATASREDRPSSTIGADSLIASADWPVALATQLRSHSRISGTDMSVRDAGVSGGGLGADCLGCESSFSDMSSLSTPSARP